MLLTIASDRSKENYLQNLEIVMPIDRSLSNLAPVTLLLVTISAPSSLAQSIAPSSTTSVTQVGNRYDITGGLRSSNGQNLFHSFVQFGLNANEIANFLANPSLRNVLGRVTGGDPSVINGLIQMTGGNANLFLINPAGMIFGPNASLNVPGAFTATTANGVQFGNAWWAVLGDSTPLNGHPTGFAFTALQPGAIVNAANLAVRSGQSLSLIGGTVVNTGTLTAPGGQITIAAVPGQTLVRLSQAGSLLNLEFQPLDPPAAGLPSGVVPSLPQLLTGGNLGHATGLTVNQDGTVQLTGSRLVVPTDGGTAIVSGTVNTVGQVGGTVNVLGDRVGLVSAQVDASGTNGGGLVRIGGDYQGHGIVPNASRTFVSQDSVIRADALNRGNGGRAIVWADEATRFYGVATAKGGSTGGNGGFAEISGKNFLDFAGRTDLSAAQGQFGTLLLDPTNITIVVGANNPAQLAANDQFADPGGNNTIANSTINVAPANVILQATNNIAFNAPISIARRGIGLTAQANNNITVTSNITTQGGSVTLTADADGTGGGILSITNATITTKNGNFTARGRGNTITATGVNISNSTINVASGRIDIRGNGGNRGGGNSDPNRNIGINLAANSLLQATGVGSIFLAGRGGGVTTGLGSSDNYGVSIDGRIEATGQASININGVGGTTTNQPNNLGIASATNRNSRISSESGNITLTGTGGNVTDPGNSGSKHIGIALSDITIESTGVGRISLTGNSEAAQGSSDGIRLFNNVTIRSNQGDISLLGQANGDRPSTPGVEGGVGIQISGVPGEQNNIITSTQGNIRLEGSTKVSTAAGVLIGVREKRFANGTFATISAIRGNVSILGKFAGVNNPSDRIVGINNTTIEARNVVIEAESTVRNPNTIQSVFLERATVIRTPNLKLGVTSFNYPFTLQADVITVDKLVTLNSPSPGAAPLRLEANQSITVGSIDAPGQAITLVSEGDINTGEINSSTRTANGGAISLTSRRGGIYTGNLNSSGINGGDILVDARTEIRTGAINSSGNPGNGGNVTLDPIGDIQVNSINAQGGNRGTGGNIDITTGRFFRALESFTDRNNILASLSSAGGIEGGSIIIRHNGGPLNEPFRVGNVAANGNGTAAAISTGINNTIFPEQFFPGFYSQGSAPNDIKLITTTISLLPEEPSPILKDPTDPESTTNSPPKIETDDGVLTAMPELALTEKIANHNGLQEERSAKSSIAAAREALRKVEKATGVRPAIIYITFVPSTLAQTKSSQRDGIEIAANPQPPTDPIESIIWRFEQPHQTSAAPSEGAFHLQVPPPPDSDTLELLLITARSKPIYRRISVTRQTIMTVVEEFRQAIFEPSKDNHVSGQTLYNWLIKPLDADLKAQGIQNLAFIMDDGLRLVPLAALYDGQQHLIERYSLTLMPSLSLVDARYGDLRKAQVLAAGASEFHTSDLAPLKAVPTEISTVSGKVWQGKALLNPEFTIANVKAQRHTTPFGIIHLATHGSFQSGKLDQSYIQFWDRKLTLDQLRNMGWNQPPVEILVLSACETAVGDNSIELGFAGVAAKAGVRTALASLWSVDDTATLALMTEFYQQLKITTIRSEALRQAQLGLLQGRVGINNGQLQWSGGQLPLPATLKNTSEDLSQPVHWSAFTMIGSPW